MQKKIIRQYYGLSFLFNIGGNSIISAVYVSFLMNNGLNLLQVNLLNAVFFFSLFICEIPTGAFADICGRKNSFVLACALTSASMLVYGSSHTFFGFIVAEILAAIGGTFRSGAFQAWLVDSLKHHGYEGEYNHIFGRENFLRQIGTAVGAISGSYMAASNQVLPWFVGAGIMMVTMIVAWYVMTEEYFVRGSLSWKKGITSMRDIAVTSIKYGTQHKPVRFILIITCIQVFSIQAMNMYWQPFFKGHHVSEKYLGFIFTGICISLTIGSFFTAYVKSAGKEKKMLIQSQICAGLIIIVVTQVTAMPWVGLLFLLHEVPRGCWSPLISSYLHKRIPSEERATIASFCSIAPHIGGAIGLVTSGFIAQYFSISTAWIVGGLSLVIGALLMAKNGEKGE